MTPPEDRPAAKDELVRRQMELQRRSGTAPEMRLRRALFASGLRFRVGYPVPGRPRRTIDIAFTKLRLAVFVDGCFWHGCPVHGVAPKHNGPWWQEKIAANQARDVETNGVLEAAGWGVIRLWEHQPVDEQLRLVEQALLARATE